MRSLLPLILALYANASFALSIGEAMLKSHLGEPLIVKLNVTDVEKSPDSNCFTITDTSDTPAFRRASSTLTPYKDGYQLTITTQSIITEPILGLRVSYHCEPQLERDYVLLLDPVTHQIGTPDDLNTSAQTAVDAKQSVKTHSSTQSTATENSSSATINKPQSKAKRKSKNRSSSTTLVTNESASVDEKMMESYVGKLQNSAKPTSAAPATKNSDKAEPNTPSVSGKPYLSISGGNLASTQLGEQKNLSLKFETQIDLNRAPPIAAVSSTELMDEVTVMSNRLTHLEKQIVSLQTKNAQLRNEATSAQNALAEQASSWIDYLLSGIGGAFLLAIILWLRHTWATKRTNKQELNWQGNSNTETSDFESTFSTTITPSVLENTQTPSSRLSASFLDDPSDDDEKMDQPKAKTLSVAEHASEEHDSIIDNADVFIEHDRPLLAIQLLQNHLNDFPTESPKIWIKLLALIASEGSEAEYTAAASDARKYFNIKFPSYSDAKIEDTSSLEDFSNIIARLEGVWGSPFAVKLLNDFIYDQHTQPAEGFTPNNFEELFFLKKIAELLNTGVSTNQRTLYRTVTTAKLNSDTESNTSSSHLDNVSFNEATFGDDAFFEQASPTESIEQANSLMISDDEFTATSFLDAAEPSRLDNPPKKDTPSQFENSPFQKVPSYDVDMLTDFDDHIETASSGIEVEALSEILTAEEIDQPLLEKDELQQEVAEEFNFPLNVYPEENLMVESDSIAADNNPSSTKSKESNLIEWDLPKTDASPKQP